ncbi:MAG: Asp-tRNA(Asn)/Glu-tRNA(Gln) amidotransferase subunit GatC [Candidatus Omnitrophica bacterium]|nr:Asp-tRNA(Asn)/Glu-tRNA(Gln) amidotransferase subunit GatC [Candidatus Omnitrophota bacterium]
MDIEYVAKLARIDLSAQEKKKLGKQLGDILTYIEKLKELNVEEVEPMSHVLPLKNVFRQDKVRPSLPKDKVLGNAPDAEGDSFGVPRVIE